MDIILSLVNILFSPVLSLIKKAFGKVELSTILGYISLGKEPVDDGRGGQKGGSIVQFELLVKNKKSEPIIIDPVYCQAYYGDDTIIEHWECQDNDHFTISAQARKYPVIRSIDVESKKSRSINIRLYSRTDLSTCDAIVLIYKIGIKKKAIDIWKKASQKKHRRLKKN